jgi:hypothetical protein
MNAEDRIWGGGGISLGIRSTSLSVQTCVRFLLIELGIRKAPYVSNRVGRETSGES